MKVLLLNQTFHPDVVASAQQASDLAVGLVGRGHEVTVVCGRRAYDNPGVLYPREEVWRGVRIRRISSPGLGKASRWRRAVDFAGYLANLVAHLVMFRPNDLTIGMTSPPLVSAIGAAFAVAKGGRFVFWVLDLNPDEALAAGWLREGSWTTRALDAVLLYSLRRSTAIVALDRFMAERIARKGIPSERITVLPPWSHDDVRYDAAGRERFRREHGLEGKFVVMYAGNHSPCHPLHTLLGAAAALADRPDIAFCFVGGGSEVETVKRFKAERGLDAIVTLPYQPMSLLSASLSSADLHTVVMGDPFVGIVHPCKIYNIQTLAIPYLYIGPEESHVTEMRPPYSARHGDVEQVVGQILKAASGWRRREGAEKGAPADVGAAGSQRQTAAVAGMVSLLERAAAVGGRFEPDTTRV